MKKKFGSRDCNLRTSALVAAILLCLTLASTTQVFAQRRLGRPPSGRQLEGTPILAPGTTVIPDGTVLIIEMDTRLDSGTAQMSDRFLARVATPVVDGAGRTLLQSGTIIEGHVASVKKAKWRHRSGELGLSFDYIEFGDGRRIPLRATLVSGSNPIDSEGDLRAKSAIKRDVLVTSGGAVAGAGIGMVTGGSMLAGGGIGAAAGLTVVFLMKGKDVNIDPGERFNLQLVQPVSLASTGNYGDGQGTGLRSGTGVRPSGTQTRRPIPLQPRAGTGTGATRRFIPGAQSGGGDPDNPNSVRTTWARVPIYDVRAERDRDGMLRVLVQSETQTTGWRIYTNHEVQPQDTLDVRLMGIPPSQYGARQISHPSASPICVEDRNNAIRRIVVRGSNGTRYLAIGSGVASARLDSNPRYTPPDQQTYQPTTPQPIQPVRPRPGAGPSDGSLGNIDFPPATSPGGNSSRPTGSLSSLGAQVANQIELLRLNYAAAIGLWVNRDGTVESLGGRRQSATERQLFDTLGYMQNSARTLASSSANSYNRQQARQQLQNDTQTSQEMWLRVRSTGVITSDLDRQWQSLQNNLRALLAAASR